MCAVLYTSLVTPKCVQLTNSVDPDEIPHYAAFHLGLHCLPSRHLEVTIKYTKG